MSRLRAKRCKDCGELKMLREDICSRCESIREQKLGIGFYDPLRQTNPELYWKKQRAEASARHRSENFAGMILSLVVGVPCLLALIGVVGYCVYQGLVGK